MKYVIPKFYSAVVRSTGPFSITILDPATGAVRILGPDTSVERVFRIPPLRVDREIEIVYNGDYIIDVQLCQEPDPLDPVDPIPLETPLGYNAPLTLQEEIRRFVRGELSAMAEQSGAGGFDEEDDFEPEDDEELHSPYEIHEMQEDGSMVKEVLDKRRQMDYDEGTVNRDGDKGEDHASRRRGTGSQEDLERVQPGGTRQNSGDDQRVEEGRSREVPRAAG